jgi:cob(I)alamin adenosyltransferase
MRGYIQVYTGDGKGKTTAALGLAIRAAGAGMKVFIGQFLKMGDYSEIKALKKFHGKIQMAQYGLGKFIKGEPTKEERAAAREGFEKLKRIVISGDFDVVIMEEANVAVRYGLLELNEVLDTMAAKPDHVELVITGRDADAMVIERADLVTEMKAIKHYFDKGVPARIGIEK